MFCWIFGVCVVVSVWSAQGFASAAKLGPRIVGGDEVKNFSQFSYQVSVQYRSSHICGGTIINKRHILTAAHCCVDIDSGDHMKASEYKIGIGNTKLRELQLFQVVAVFVHEKFDVETVDNDIAVMRVSKDLPNWAIETVNVTTPAKTACVVSGWGVLYDGSTTVSQNMMKVNIHMVDHLKCAIMYNNQISDNMICAADPNKDSCQGDSGGPLVCNDQLTGIVSWGYRCAKSQPGVYTNVVNYNSWIEKQFVRSAGIMITRNDLFITLLCILIFNKVFK